METKRRLEEVRVACGLDRVSTKEEMVRCLLSKIDEDETITILLEHPDPESVSPEQSCKDFRRERVLLNDIPFVPHKEHTFRNDGFGATLGQLCRLLGEQDDTAKEVILRNACRTSSGADAYFCVRSLLCVPELFLAQRSCSDDPPVKVDVFRSEEGKLCSRVVSVNAFSLFLEADVGLDMCRPPPPYLVVEAKVTDEMVFGGKDQRRLSLQIFTPRPELGDSSIGTSALELEEDFTTVSSTSTARLIPLQSPSAKQRMLFNIL
jgi:hypothetical protein